MRKVWETVDLFALGGCAYGLLEVLWRGYTHWTMTALGGGLFVALGKLNRALPRKTPLLARCLLGGATVTGAEFATGCLVNLKLGMHVWDYSNMPLQIKGQVCLPYSLLWGALSMAAAEAYNFCCCLGWNEPPRSVFYTKFSTKRKKALASGRHLV
jgi:hypothetical protein